MSGIAEGDRERRETEKSSQEIVKNIQKKEVDGVEHAFRSTTAT